MMLEGNFLNPSYALKSQGQLLKNINAQTN